ncbi:MAG: prepilin-type N-terminal cleavage/methylation domain-containing protein [Methylomarinum sp.]|nr:prepilin-type N-terminal cleavage/methylation domain-containing protein [Methylomarinum sp.]
MISIKQRGMTLIELTVVLLILVALAGLAIPYVSGTSSKALCDATDISMANIKKVIMDRYYLDTLGKFPATEGGIDYSLNYLMTSGGWPNFDPDSQIGWRGPYLQGAITLGTTNISILDNSFQDISAAPNHHVNKDFVANDFAVFDGWGRPIVIQVTDDCDNWEITSMSGQQCARLVSAGPFGGLGIGNAAIDTQILNDTSTPTVLEQHRQNDDRILYLNAPTPAQDVNPSCDN